jgi:histone deacetylase complex regulatory component SIN3
MDNELYIKEFISNERKLLEHKWEQENLEQWDNKIVEKYEDVYTTEKIFFEIDSFKNIEQNKVVIYEQIIKLLNNKDIRKKAIKFTITDNEKHIELIDKFEEYSNLIWNGMRKLPYENDEIAKVMSDLIQIIDVSISEYEKSDKDFLKIGFSDITGAGNDAFVNENFLYEAMRDDLKDCIVENTKDVMTLIYHIRSPQLLYKFEALKKLFVESIILSQVVYGGNNFVIYSPTEVRVFGLP